VIDAFARKQQAADKSVGAGAPTLEWDAPSAASRLHSSEVLPRVAVTLEFAARPLPSAPRPLNQSEINLRSIDHNAIELARISEPRSAISRAPNAAVMFAGDLHALVCPRHRSPGHVHSHLAWSLPYSASRRRRRLGALNMP